MNLYSILTLSARLSMLPARIALHTLDTIGSRLSHRGPTDNLPDVAGGDRYWLYWVHPEQRIPTRPHTSTPSARQSQL